MYELCLGDGKGYAQGHCSGLDGPEQSLETADISTVGKRGDGQDEGIHVGEDHPTRDSEME